jgi:predicted AAA+ superfamily ATPase
MSIDLVVKRVYCSTSQKVIIILAERQISALQKKSVCTIYMHAYKSVEGHPLVLLVKEYTIL